MLDPDVQTLLDTVFKPVQPPCAPDLAQIRAAALQAPLKLGGVAEPLDGVHDTTVFGPGGLIPVRIYRGHSTQPRPLCVYAHGGGWVAGSLDSHDKLCRALANRLQAVVLAVDYRLAPEHEFPQALDDVETIWRWALAHAASLDADGETFMVAGDSSGGNIVAALCLRLRAKGGSQPDLQLLMYPALDARCEAPAYAEFAHGFNLSADDMRWYWQRYAGGRTIASPEYSPALADDLRNLAPAVIVVAENDVLRDDGLAYARRLEDAQVGVTLVRCDGMIHGFLRWAGAVPAVGRWLDTIAAAARHALERTERRVA